MLPDNKSGSIDGAELIKVSTHFYSHWCNLTHLAAKAHPWFRGLDWTNIHRYPAPFKPELRNPEDTRHFDSDIPAEVSSNRTRVGLKG